jgi:hypothetical protein
VIASLNEQKHSVIHYAVTRGLDPSVPLKPSGISWLGDIPRHWEALRSKYVYREVDVRSATGHEPHLSMSQRFGLIPSSQIEAKRLVSESYAGAKLCQRGDLVLNRLKAHLGVFALAPEPGVVSPDYTVLRPAREVDERFFEAVYRTPGSTRMISTTFEYPFRPLKLAVDPSALNVASLFLAPRDGVLPHDKPLADDQLTCQRALSCRDKGRTW